MPPSPPAPRPRSDNGPVFPLSAHALAEPSAYVTSHLEAEEKGPSYIKGSRMQAAAGVKEIPGAGVRGGEAGTKWEHLPWAGEESPPACTALGTFWIVLFSKQGPRGTRWAGTPTLSRLLLRGDNLNPSPAKIY